jgi:hypothetical protein
MQARDAKCIYCGVKMKHTHNVLCPYITPYPKLQWIIAEQQKLLQAALDRIKMLEERQAPE